MRLLFVLIACLLLVILCMYNRHREGFSSTPDFIISINVHENKDFLIKQLANIKEYVEGKYIVVLNCNEYMYNELKDAHFDNNVIINPEIINKQRFTGTLLKGICSNMKVVIDNNIQFSYFLILSSRNLFYCKINANEIEKIPKIGYPSHQVNFETWHWPVMTKTKLAQYYMSKNRNLISSCHEGFIFNYDTFKNVYEFLESHTDIRDDLFSYNASVEEFALQTIIVNQDSYFYNINQQCNGSSDDINTLTCGEHRFLYKTDRT